MNIHNNGNCCVMKTVNSYNEGKRERARGLHFVITRKSRQMRSEKHTQMREMTSKLI